MRGKSTILIIVGILLLTNTLLCADQSIPSLIEEKIKRTAKTEYPGDYKTQLYVIKKEMEAYRAIQNYKPHNIYYLTLDEIKGLADDKYPDNYDMQFYTVKKEVAAYLEIENTKANNDYGIGWNVFLEIKDRVQAKYPGQYSTQLDEIKKEIRAYLKLNR